jgi:hypothetical protein
LKSISLNVPAGSYVVSASMFAANRGSKEGRVGCNLSSPSDSEHFSGAVANLPKTPTETFISYQQPEAQGVFTIGGSGGTIEYECSNAEGPAEVELYGAQIIATAVASLTG